MLALASESDETSRRSTARCSAGVAGTARWRKCGPAAKRRANGVAFSADNRASDALRRLLEVVPRGLRRLWDGRPAPVTLAQFPARHHLAGKIRFRHPALYYNYPLFTGVMHLLGARLTLAAPSTLVPGSCALRVRAALMPDQADLSYSLSLMSFSGSHFSAPLRRCVLSEYITVHGLNIYAGLWFWLCVLRGKISVV